MLPNMCTTANYLDTFADGIGFNVIVVVPPSTVLFDKISHVGLLATFASISDT